MYLQPHSSDTVSPITDMCPSPHTSRVLKVRNNPHRSKVIKAGGSSTTIVDHVPPFALAFRGELTPFPCLRGILGTPPLNLASQSTMLHISILVMSMLLYPLGNNRTIVLTSLLG